MILPQWNPGFASGEPKAASLIFEDSAGVTNNGSGFNFTGRPLGSPKAGRIHLLYLSLSFLISGTINSVTIDGQVCTRLSGATAGGLFACTASGNSSGNISVSCSSTAFGCSYSLWSANDLLSITPVAVQTSSFGTSPRSLSINTLSGGVVVGIAEGLNNGTYGWSGLTEDAELAFNPSNSSRASFASGAFSVTQALGISTTYGGNHTLSAVSLR